MLEAQKPQNATWRSTCLRISRDVGEIAHDFAWLTGWTARRIGAAYGERTFLAIRRRLGLQV